jgi:hypothetical protein
MSGSDFDGQDRQASWLVEWSRRLDFMTAMQILAASLRLVLLDLGGAWSLADPGNGAKSERRVG